MKIYLCTDRLWCFRLRDTADWFEGTGFVVQPRCVGRIRHRFVGGVLGSGFICSSRFAFGFRDWFESLMCENVCCKKLMLWFVFVWYDVWFWLLNCHRFLFYSAGLEETESMVCAEGKWICCWILELKHGRLCLDWDENFWIWDYLDMDKKENED